MGIRIVSDSSSNVFDMPGIDYTTVPLKVMFGGTEYVDEPGTDFEQMILALQEHDGPSTTSCPNVHEWLHAFEGASEVFGITISDGLSGSYAAAHTAQQQFLEQHPGAKAYIVDSGMTGPSMELMIDEMKRRILASEPFDQIREAVVRYRERVRILYALESLNNLANNGRVKPALSKLADVLNIRIIGHASEQGTIELLHRCRGEKKTVHTLFNEMLSNGFRGGRVRISHTLNLEAATKLQTFVLDHFPVCDVGIRPNTGLCSYYSDLGGLIVGYEVEA